MRNTPIHIGTAAYRASVACSLYEVILEKIDEEDISPTLVNLIRLACDLNFEISRSFADAKEKVSY